jgi:hypothetical protein
MSATDMGKWVEVAFDCVPLRTLGQICIPEDASPKLAEKLARMQRSLEIHGKLNSYYLHNAKCVFHFTNDPQVGMCQFDWEGVVLTDSNDMHARSCDLRIQLTRETCSWLHQAIVDWLMESVQRAVMVEFDRYIQAGDLSRTIQRMEELQRATEESGGFVGMYL